MAAEWRRAVVISIEIKRWEDKRRTILQQLECNSPGQFAFLREQSRHSAEWCDLASERERYLKVRKSLDECAKAGAEAVCIGARLPRPSTRQSLATHGDIAPGVAASPRSSDITL